MGRFARQTIANIPYHIINRGNNHQPIFFCDDDYKFFLDALEVAKEKYPCKIYGFVLMTNHIHLLLEAVDESMNLSNFMKHATQRHGQYINKLQKTNGTLLGKQFKKIGHSETIILKKTSKHIGSKI